VHTLSSRTLTAVWLALLTATAFTAFLTETGRGNSWATSAILVIASAKIGLIMTTFMELDAAPRRMQLAFGLWLTTVTSIVVVGLLVS
jgi:heme/copper-type cytochrome/quinol oxidase subunit 4